MSKPKSRGPRKINTGPKIGKAPKLPPEGQVRSQERKDWETELKTNFDFLMS